MPRHLSAQLLAPAGAVLGEGPAWDTAADCLVWVDIQGFQVHRTGADGTPLGSHSFDRQTSAVLPTAVGGSYLVVLRDRLVRLDTEGPSAGRIEPVLDVLADRPDLRFNDAKCDPRGRAFAGTMAIDEVTPDLGALLRLDPGPKVTAVHGPTSLSNGLGWSPDGRLMYFIDTPAGTVTAFDYDADTGRPSNPRTLLMIRLDGGGPDGMCVDDDGCLWIALWGGRAVYRYTPDGRLDTVLEVPVGRVSNCAFGPGGRLYITTASVGLDEAGRAAEPYAGGLFVAEPGVGGPTATPWQPV